MQELLLALTQKKSISKAAMQQGLSEVKMLLKAAAKGISKWTPFHSYMYISRYSASNLKELMYFYFRFFLIYLFKVSNSFINNL
jgi:hypothetical protein